MEAQSYLDSDARRCSLPCIPDIIAAEGQQYEIKVLYNLAYKQALLAKIVEEAQEVSSASEDELMKELADLYEVLDALILAFNLDPKAIQDLQQSRCKLRGGFEKRIQLIWAED